MTSIHSITLEVSDATAAAKFYAEAFGLGDRLKLVKSDAATSGFRGYTISLLVSQPANASALFDAAVAAGATTLKPINKSLWGVGGVIQAPDGAIWKFATTAKKDTAPASSSIDSIVVLLAAGDVGASKKFYESYGLKVGKSFGSYVEFATPGSPVGFGLYARKALAKDAGVAPEGTGSHRIAMNSDAGSFTDPDGFVWA
jgi:uncharacterized glyoxalase superfamily protein PhnB